MNTIVNLGMLKHPANWVTLLIWLMFIGVFVHIFHVPMMQAYPSKMKASQ